MKALPPESDGSTPKKTQGNPSQDQTTGPKTDIQMVQPQLTTPGETGKPTTASRPGDGPRRVLFTEPDVTVDMTTETNIPATAPKSPQIQPESVPEAMPGKDSDIPHLTTDLRTEADVKTDADSAVTPVSYEDALRDYLGSGTEPSAVLKTNADTKSSIPQEAAPKTKEQIISELAPKISKPGITPGRAVLESQRLYADVERIFGSNADVVLETFESGQDPRKFLDGFQNAYLAGKMGNRAALKNSSVAEYLTEEQRSVAFELGERAGSTVESEGHRVGFGAEETFERNRAGKNQLVKKGNADTILDEDMRIPVEKLQRMTLQGQARELDRLLYKYTDKESKWKGEIVEVSRAELPKARGRKLWGCSILVRNDADIKTKIHELLHARSFSHKTELAYARWKYSEEAAVEMFAREICNRNGVSYKPAYSCEVKQLTIAKNILFPDVSNYDFAKYFFEKDMLERYDWLRKEADLLIARNILSPKNVAALNTAVDTFRRLLINENSR